MKVLREFVEADPKRFSLLGAPLSTLQLLALLFPF